MVVMDRRYVRAMAIACLIVGNIVEVRAAIATRRVQEGMHCEGSDAAIVCQQTDDIPWCVEWLRNGISLNAFFVPPPTKYRASATFRLIIGNMSVRDSGNYSLSTHTPTGRATERPPVELKVRTDCDSTQTLLTASATRSGHDASPSSCFSADTHSQGKDDNTTNEGYSWLVCSSSFLIAVGILFAITSVILVRHPVIVHRASMYFGVRQVMRKLRRDFPPERSYGEFQRILRDGKLIISLVTCNGDPDQKYKNPICLKNDDTRKTCEAAKASYMRLPFVHIVEVTLVTNETENIQKESDHRRRHHSCGCWTVYGFGSSDDKGR